MHSMFSLVLVKKWNIFWLSNIKATKTATVCYI